MKTKSARVALNEWKGRPNTAVVVATVHPSKEALRDPNYRGYFLGPHEFDDAGPKFKGLPVMFEHSMTDDKRRYGTTTETFKESSVGNLMTVVEMDMKNDDTVKMWNRIKQGEVSAVSLGMTATVMEESGENRATQLYVPKQAYKEVSFVYVPDITGANIVSGREFDDVGNPRNEFYRENALVTASRASSSSLYMDGDNAHKIDRNIMTDANTYTRPTIPTINSDATPENVPESILAKLRAADETLAKLRAYEEADAKRKADDELARKAEIEKNDKELYERFSKETLPEYADADEGLKQTAYALAERVQREIQTNRNVSEGSAKEIAVAASKANVMMRKRLTVAEAEMQETNKRLKTEYEEKTKRMETEMEEVKRQNARMTALTGYLGGGPPVTRDVSIAASASSSSTTTNSVISNFARTLAATRVPTERVEHAAEIMISASRGFRDDIDNSIQMNVNPYKKYGDVEPMVPGTSLRLGAYETMSTLPSFVLESFARNTDAKFDAKSLKAIDEQQ